MIVAPEQRPSLRSTMSVRRSTSSDRHCVSTISVRALRSKDCEVVLVKYRCESEMTPAPEAEVQ